MVLFDTRNRPSRAHPPGCSDHRAPGRTLGRLSVEDVSETVPDLAERLGRAIVVETGQPLFAVHEHGPDEIVIKLSLSTDIPEYAAGELDRLHLAWDGMEVPVARVLRRAARRRSAMHDEEGVLVVAGPHIRPGTVVDARLVDIAPTLFHAAGLAVPDGLEGSVLDLFA